jgi:hypothetical protein
MGKAGDGSLMAVDFAIVAIAKNENSFVEEWINYHRAVGFEHIYLYDNAGPNDESLDFLREAYSDTVTLTKLPGPGRQSAAYRHFCEHFKAEARWVAFIDLDEFVVFRQHGNASAFVSEFEHIDSIGLSWLMFGHSGHERRPEGLVMEDYTWRYPFCFPQIKTFCRSSAVDEILSVHNINHRAKLITGYDLQGADKVDVLSQANKFCAELDTTGTVAIHHYFSRSLEDIANKLARGSAAGTVNRSFDWFFAKKEIFSSTLDMTGPLLIRRWEASPNRRYAYYKNNPKIRNQRFHHLIAEDFDSHWYGSFYPDLAVQNLSSAELEQHFVLSGAFEGRAWNERIWFEKFFDPKQYRSIHADLASLDDVSARYHYFVAGRFEGRELFSKMSKLPVGALA